MSFGYRIDPQKSHNGPLRQLLDVDSTALECSTRDIGFNHGHDGAPAAVRARQKHPSELFYLVTVIAVIQWETVTTRLGVVVRWTDGQYAPDRIATPGTRLLASH